MQSVQYKVDEIPADWSMNRLGSICRIRTGKKDVNQGNPAGIYPFFTCSKEIHYSDDYSFDTEAILVAGNGAVGETKYYCGKFEAYQRTYVLDQFPTFAPFLFFYLKSSLTVELAKHVTGSTMPYIRKGDLENIAVPIPPFEEQRKIASVLELVQRAIEQQERLIALTQELKKSLMHKLFTVGLHGEPQKQTEIGPVPESWEVTRLGEVISDDPKNGIYKHSSFYGSGTLILRINDFSNDGDVVRSAPNRVRTDAFENSTYELRPEDIVTNRVNSLSHLGKTALIGDISEPMVFESNMMRFRINKKRALPEYIFLVLNSPICKKQFLGSAKRAVGQASINQGNLKAILISLPPVTLQKEISEAVEAVVSKVDLHQKKLAVLSDLFRTLLHQLMTAQIRVHDLDLSELGLDSDPPMH